MSVHARANCGKAINRISYNGQDNVKRCQTCTVERFIRNIIRRRWIFRLEGEASRERSTQVVEVPSVVTWQDQPSGQQSLG